MTKSKGGRPKNTKRNALLIRDRKRGLSWWELAMKYGFKSHATARKIFVRDTARS